MPLFAAHGVGYADLTVKVTGLGGRTATRTLHHAASAAVQNAADSRYCPRPAGGSPIHRPGWVGRPPTGAARAISR
ncbi:hypothetical protein GCM10009665_35810 [Kitasatospora nipponensis]|uniref:Uncharacterized protein n=1 Tax=Kitasatospora nipponensis TaxID=258049 RepID=A0ABN1WDL5_9ACTN